MPLMCCVMDCISRTAGERRKVRLHRFPINDEQLCSLWMERIGDTALMQVDKKILNSSRRICHRHFHPMCQVDNRKGLRDYSVPTMYMANCANLEQTKANCILNRSVPIAAIIRENRIAKKKETDHKMKREFLKSQTLPTVFKNVLNWACIKWSIDKWMEVFGDETLFEFSVGKQAYTRKPQFQNKIRSGTFKNLLSYNGSKDYWSYFDYKHLNQWFKSSAALRQNIHWDLFGLPEHTADDSTIWIGTTGAHTNCHIDTYGFNIVAQVYGIKEWILFPPDEDLKATRVPYEESSIFSKLNLYSPNFNDFQHVEKAYHVILHPGEALLVPNGWWHYVENMSVSISINIWLEHENDYINHTREATVQMLVEQLTKELPKQNQKSIVLTPANEDTPQRTLQDLTQIIEYYSNPTLDKTNNESSAAAEIEEYQPFLGKYRPVDLLSKSELHKLLLAKSARFKKIINEETVEDDEDGTIPILQHIVDCITTPKIVNPLVDELVKKIWHR